MSTDERMEIRMSLPRLESTELMVGLESTSFELQLAEPCRTLHQHKNLTNRNRCLFESRRSVARQ